MTKQGSELTLLIVALVVIAIVVKFICSLIF